MAVRRVATVGVGGFTHRSTSRSSITVGGQRRIVGATGPSAINIGGATRVTRVSRGGTSATGGGTSGRKGRGK